MKKRGTKRFAESRAGTLSDVRFHRGNFATARSAQPHGSDRCAQKADPHPLFKGVSQILLCDEFYSGIFSLNGTEICAPSDRPYIHLSARSVERMQSGDNNKPRRGPGRQRRGRRWRWIIEISESMIARGVVNRNRTSENRHLRAAVAAVVIRRWMLRRRLATICANVTVASLLLEIDELCCIRELVGALAGIRQDSRRSYITVYTRHVKRTSVSRDNGPFRYFFGLLIYDGAPYTVRPSIFMQSDFRNPRQLRDLRGSIFIRIRVYVYLCILCVA